MVVTAATVPAREGAHPLLEVRRHRCSRLRLLWAAHASTGDLAAWVWALRPWRTVHRAVVTRLEGLKGCQVLPQRWMVERTFAWLNRYRRLSQAYADLPQTSATRIRVAMIHLMIRRLARLVPS